MSKEKFNRSIDKLDVPLHKLIKREKIAIHQAKKKKKVKKMATRSFLTACCLCLGLLSTGFFSSNMTEALSKVPIIGTIYKEFGEMAADHIEKNQFATIIEKQDQNESLTMTVKEAAYDGGRLLVTVAYAGKTNLLLEEKSIGHQYVTINGETIKSAMETSTQSLLNSNTIIEMHEFTFTNYNEYGNSIEVALHGKNLFGTKGDLQVRFPLKKVQGKIVEINPKAKVQDESYTIEAEKVIFSPLSTRIDLNIDYPEQMDTNDTWPWFNFYAIDDQGNTFDGTQIESGMANDNGHHIILRLPPMEQIPTSLTLIPKDVNQAGQKYNLTALKLKIPLEHNIDE